MKSPVVEADRFERSKRKFRLYMTPHMLLLISTLIYFSPYAIGYFEYISPGGIRHERHYSSQVGIAVALIITMLLACIAFFGRRRKPIVVASSNSVESFVLAAAILVTGIYVLATGQAGIINKQVLLAQTDRIDLFFYVLCSIGFIFAVLAGYRTHKGLLAISLLGLLFVVYLGHRSSLVIAIIGAAYVRFRDRPIPRIPLKYVLLAATLFFAVAVYKSVYVAVKMGDWDLVIERLSPENILSSSTAGMEQFMTFAHLDFFVADNFRLACSNAWLIPFSIFPYAETLLSGFWDVAGCYYNVQVQPIYFPGYSGGVAANIWAEFFGYFGYFGFPILIAILTMFYWVIERAMQKIKSPVLISGLIVAVVNLSFYIQRKELYGAFISGKRAVMAALIVFLAAWILRKVNRRVPHAYR